MASDAEATRRIRHAVVATACLCLILLGRGQGSVRERWTARVFTQLALLNGFRSIEPRISADLPHAPFRIAQSAGFLQLARRNPALASEVDALLTASTGARVRETVDLLLANWNETIDGLTRAAPKDDSSWIDLACAYYMRGLTTRSLNDFARALQCLSNAKVSPRVTFNRALVLEQLRDREAAAAEWRAYLAVDDDSAWAAEARDRLRKSTRRAHTATPSRKNIERDLLPQWAEASLGGKSSAAADALQAARGAAEHLSRLNGDRALPKIIAQVDASMPETRMRFAAAFRAYGAGRRAVEEKDAAKGFRELLRAKEVFHGLGSAEGEVLATSFLVTARYLADDYDNAERFAREADRCRSDCDAVIGRIEWVRGMIHFQRGYPSASLRSFSRALQAFERLGEKDQQASQHTNLADAYRYLGDADRSAVHRYHALVLTEEIDEPMRLQSILTEVAEAAVADSLPAAAFVFQDRVVRLARGSNDVFQIADALMVRGILNQRIGQRGAALRDLGEARQMAERIADEPTREKMFSYIDTAEAFALREADDRRAIDRLDRSISFLRHQGSHTRLAQLLLERGRAQLRLGDVTEAELDFHDGIRELEEQRRRVDEPELRIAYFDGADRLFSDLALLLLQRGRAAEAFDVLERSRARELLDAATGQTMQPLPLNDLQRQLGADVAVVTYMIAKDRVIAAIVTRNALRFVARRIGEDDLHQLVDRVSRGFDLVEGLPRDDLRRLHDTLIAPLRVDPRMRLVLVPDRFLYQVPFAALLAPNGRYLVEDRVIAIAPSATLHLRNASRDCALASSAASSILLVASPERPEGFESLEPLWHTTTEAAAIAKHYQNARVLRSPREDAILAEGVGYSIIHFASHSVLNENDPAESMLLLGTKGRLRVAQIEAIRFARTRLVVLGACSSGIGKAFRGEGVLSLARAFMSASVPSVVATVAPVEDEAAARLLTSFHGAYALGLDPASALRHAQLVMLRNKDRSFADPARWSAFQAIGGACANVKQREENTLWASH